MPSHQYLGQPTICTHGHHKVTIFWPVSVKVEEAHVVPRQWQNRRIQTKFIAGNVSLLTHHNNKSDKRAFKIYLLATPHERRACLFSKKTIFKDTSTSPMTLLFRSKGYTLVAKVAKTTSHSQLDAISPHIMETDQMVESQIPFGIVEQQIRHRSYSSSVSEQMVIHLYARTRRHNTIISRLRLAALCYQSWKHFLDLYLLWDYGSRLESKLKAG